jgi:hypothetical protein
MLFAAQFDGFEDRLFMRGRITSATETSETKSSRTIPR